MEPRAGPRGDPGPGFFLTLPIPAVSTTRSCPRPAACSPRGTLPPCLVSAAPWPLTWWWPAGSRELAWVPGGPGQRSGAGATGAR